MTEEVEDVPYADNKISSLKLTMVQLKNCGDSSKTCNIAKSCSIANGCQVYCLHWYFIVFLFIVMVFFRNSNCKHAFKYLFILEKKDSAIRCFLLWWLSPLFTLEYDSFNLFTASLQRNSNFNP